MPASRLLPLLLLAALLTALLAGRLSGAAEDGLAIVSVEVAAVDRTFFPEDEPGPPVRLARKLVITGRGFSATSVGPLVELRLDDGRRVRSPLVVQPDDVTIEAWVPEGHTGGATLVLTDASRTTATRRVEL